MPMYHCHGCGEETCICDESPLHPILRWLFIVTIGPILYIWNWLIIRGVKDAKL